MNKEYSYSCNKCIRNAYWISAVIISIILLIASVSKIRPGEVGIVVNPFGENKGVEKQELTIGIHFLAPWKSVYKFPTYEQNHQWTEDEMFTFQTSEGLPVKAEIGISFHLEQDRIHELFGKYRKGMEEITQLYVKNILRDSLNRVSSKIKIEDLFGVEKESFFNQVHTYLNKELNHVGFHISHVYLIGKLDVPEIVTAALNKKIEATQRAQQRENELRESEAEAKKEIARVEGTSKALLIEARSKAEANNVLNKSLTPELLKWKHIEKWDGKLPHAITGSDASVLLNLQ